MKKGKWVKFFIYAFNLREQKSRLLEKNIEAKETEEKLSLSDLAAGAEDNMQSNFIAPEFNGLAFSCPYCKICAKQDWLPFKTQEEWENLFQFLQNAPSYMPTGFGDCNIVLIQVRNFVVSEESHKKAKLLAARCTHCKKYSYWLDGKMIWPGASTVEMPSADMPEECRGLYLEARDIADKSPRSAAALLRLCVEKLMPHLGRNEKKLADAIQTLADESRISQSELEYLHICRLIGNDAVHPREISLSDKQEIVLPLFKFVNILVQRTLSADKERKNFIAGLPSNIQEKIAGNKEVAAINPNDSAEQD